MAIHIDLSKPLTEDEIKDMRTRMPSHLVDHYVELAGTAEGSADGSGPIAGTEDSVSVSDLDEEGLRALSAKVAEGVDLIVARAAELGIELDEFPPETDETADPVVPEDLIGASPTEEPFDPSKADVEAVLEHLKTADAEEKARVLALESDGKKRKTVLEA